MTRTGTGSIKQIWLCLLIVTILSGCAFGTRRPTLTYPPASEEPAAAVAQAAVPVAAKNMTVVLASFRDERSDKSTVGTVRNGFGMRTADVVPNNTVSEWVTQAVATELRSNGYKVVSGTASDPKDPNALWLSGDVLNVFCDMYFSYTGQVSLLAKGRNAQGELFTKHYAGEGTAGIAWAATGDSFAQSLALALRDALNKLMADLNAMAP